MDFYVIQIYIEIVFILTRNFGIKIFRIPSILLNSVFNGWLKLLIVALARKWAVLLTNYKWAVLIPLEFKNGLHILTNLKWAISSLPPTSGLTKLTRPLKKQS